MIKPIYFILILLLISFVNSCKPKPNLPEAKPGSADFTSMAFIGGTYFSGYQDGALYKEGQENSIPAILAKQIELINNHSLNAALLDESISIGLTFKGDPYQNKFNLENKSDCLGEVTLKPSNSKINFSIGNSLRNGITSTTNISVPFASIQDYSDPLFGEQPTLQKPNPFYYRIASKPGTSTMLSDLEQIKPTFTAIWTGMEDIYNFALMGGYDSQIADPAVFENRLDELLKIVSNNEGKGVLANIPDISVFPFYTLIPSLSIDLTKEKADSLNLVFGTIFEYKEGKNGFQIEDESVENFPYRLSFEDEYVLLNTPLDSVKCHKMGVFNPLPDRYILDRREIAFIKDQIRIYNEIIKRKAEQYDMAFVDMNYYFNSISTGITVDGISYSSEFVSGGFFSLDGFQPNQKGYALLANKFIEAINQKYSASIPSANCKSCSGIKFP
ncbi:MAG: SGNH/GDSL hydrolase family protein [Bacteroidota bacterium]|nr:SGNH/GDSL hydrolase family protein [Bacteroidota bacterium]